MSGITASELLDALALATTPRGIENTDARTVRELCEASGLGERRVRAELQRLHAAGRLQVHQVRRRALGRMAVVPAYTITPLPKPARRQRKK